MLAGPWQDVWVGAPDKESRGSMIVWGVCKVWEKASLAARRGVQRPSDISLQFERGGEVRQATKFRLEFKGSTVALKITRFVRKILAAICAMHGGGELAAWERVEAVARARRPILEPVTEVVRDENDSQEIRKQ